MSKEKLEINLKKGLEKESGFKIIKKSNEILFFIKKIIKLNHFFLAEKKTDGYNQFK